MINVLPRKNKSESMLENVPAVYICGLVNRCTMIHHNICIKKI